MTRYRSLENMFRDIVSERHLTPAEKNKREEVAQAIEREHPGIDMGKKMAIATSVAKKIHGEETEVEQEPVAETKEEAPIEEDAEELDETLIDVAVHQFETLEWSQLDELSKKTLGRYIRAASDSRSSHSANAEHHQNRINDTDRDFVDAHKNAMHRSYKTARKRAVGIARAVDKLTKEEYDELNELSKDTLTDYVGYATIDKGKHDKKAVNAIVAGDKKTFDRHHDKSVKRSNGIAKAASKLHSEETIEELKASTLKSYLNRSDLSRQHHMSKRSKAATAGDREGYDNHDRVVYNRKEGFDRAAKRLRTGHRVTKEEAGEDTMATIREQAMQALMERRGRPPKDPEKLKAYHASKGSDGDEDDGARSSIKHLSKGADHPAGGHLTIGGVQKHYPRSMHRAALSKLRDPQKKPHEKQALEKDMFSSHERFVHHAKAA